MAEQAVDTATAINAKAATPVKVKRLGHVVYKVSDIERTTRFWTEILGFTVSDHNRSGMVFLRHGSDHHTIALMPAPGKARPEEGAYLGTDHFAMEVETLESLFEIRAFLRQMNVPIVFEGRHGPGSNVGVEFLDPDGYVLELYWHMDQVGPDGRSRPADQFRRAASLEEAVANPVPDSW